VNALRVSVVMPALNEAARIGSALDALARHVGLHEVIVVDGGSDDDTARIVEAFRGVTLFRAPRGRASQMNAGAAHATGDVLLFLHVDVALPADALFWIDSALSESGTVAGAFRTHTVSDGAGAAWAAVLCIADVRSWRSRLPYGDQAIFVRADVFRRIGGYPRQPILEDLEFSRLLWREGRVRIVRAAVRVSGRRFTRRPVYSTAVTVLIPWLYRLGVSADRLNDLYGHIR
jgi:rSAM/selenodomain-associated transferase 2